MTLPVVSESPAPTTVDASMPEHGPEIRHFRCMSCSPDRRFCGGKSKNPGPPEPAHGEICVVCLDLWMTLNCCPRCGGDLDTCWGRNQ